MNEKTTKNNRISVRVDEAMHSALAARAERYNCSISDIVKACVTNDTSSLDRRAVYEKLMRVTELLEKQEKTYGNIDNNAIREELYDLCILLNS